MAEFSSTSYVCLAGPTASGKSAAAMALARVRPIEIISVDSALVYRHMDIGTAKPSAAERSEVPHHLIDLIEPTESYSAAQFVAQTLALIPQIHARGRLPVLVGGTMLYFKALLQGMDTLPATDPALRSELDAQAAALGWPAMHERLAQVDPVTALRLAPNDAQRIQRALEVWLSSGQTLSSLHTGRLNGEGMNALPSACLAFISLEPNDRPWLHERIAQRFDAMLGAGLLDEVRSLRHRGDLQLNLPSMRCVGYRQIWQAMDLAANTALSAAQLGAVRERGIAATRQLAKRQLTWLRSFTRQIIACDTPHVCQDVIHAIESIAS